MKYKAAQEAGIINSNEIIAAHDRYYKFILNYLKTNFVIFKQILGFFDQEIVSVSVPGRKGTTTLISKDENPRPETTKEGLGKLRPAFVKVDIPMT